jgi:glycosyltransferase involved in cell wall biosynthesis
MPHEAPAFSVVVPLYNKVGQVCATLASVLSQTLLPREILVIDNGSTDGGAQAVEAIASPIVRLLHEDQRGPGPARNRGIAEATSEWIAFIDADDLWAPNHLEVLAGVIARHPHGALVGAGFRWATLPVLAPPADPTAVTAPSRVIDFLEGANCDLVWTSAVAARRGAIIAAGGFADFQAGEDYDLWIRLALLGDFAVSSAQTAVYVRGPGGIMEDEHVRLQGAVPPPPSPNFATIAALLADPAHHARHAALRRHSDMLRLRYARQLVYHGHGAAARALLRGAAARGRRWWLWWSAALLPGFVLRFAARLWRLRHRLDRRRSGL